MASTLLPLFTGAIVYPIRADSAQKEVPLERHFRRPSGVLGV